jgi:two-component system, NarL family, sensor histidine kinase BarA
MNNYPNFNQTLNINFRQDILHNMSHELRTPLIGIVGLSEVLLEKVIFNENKELADCILKSGKRLYDTIKLLMLYFQFNLNTMNTNFKIYNINSLIEGIITEYKSISDSKSIEVFFAKSKQNMDVLIDYDLIETALRNLYDNAIKFTNSGSVVVTAEIITDISDKKMLSVSLQDSGIGIPDGLEEMIFDEFYQVSSGLSRKYEGMGLGLHVAKKCVEKLDGQVYAQKNLIKGSIFNIEIPIKSK